MTLAVLGAFAASAASARAGGGPETTLVVVNRRSPLSCKLAHEYCVLRDIPESHVCMLDGIPHLRVITLEQFKTLIAEPILSFLKGRGLEGQIDLITYSADFPYAVKFKDKAEGAGNARWMVGNQASLTGATYLVRRVLAGEEFWKADINPYFRLRTATLSAADRSAANAAFAEANARRFGKAAAMFRKLVSQHPGNPALSFHLARCLAQSGQDGDAFQALAQAIGNGLPAAAAQRDPLLKRLQASPKFREALATKVAPRAKLAPPMGFVAGEQNAFLCTMLGYTGERGNSLSEIRAYLDAAAKTDFSKPRGTVYFCRNKDVRTRTRLPHFDDTMRRLRLLGRPSELVDANLPPARNDVLGAVVGIANFDWAKSKSTILGGAICEHLTSHGGNFGTKGQTKLSAFLRAGAAGASGTVQEPLALQWKFPVPQIHVFYAEGHSLAEAFYQSVHGPYQLLICGDGLARPFAEPSWVKPGLPQAGPDEPPLLKGVVRFTPSAGVEGDIAVRYELWLNGLRQPGLELDTTKLDDGHHDIRVVAVVGALQTRSYTKVTAEVRNSDRKLVIAGGVPGRIKGAKRYELLWGNRPVDPEGLAAVAPGPLRLQWRSVFADGGAYRGPVFVGGATAVPTGGGTPAFYGIALPGLSGHRIEADGRRVPVAIQPGGDLPAGEKPPVRYELAGYLAPKTTGRFLQLGARGRGAVKVNGKAVPLNQWRPVLVAPNTTLKIEYEPRGKPRLELLLNGDCVMQRAAFEHRGDPPTKEPPETDPKLVNGKRAGKPVPVPKKGLELSWRKTQHKVVSVTLFGDKLPAQWTLAATTGRKPSKVAGVTVLRGPGFVQLRLPKRRSVRRMLLTPAKAAALTEVAVGVAKKR